MRFTTFRALSTAMGLVAIVVCVCTAKAEPLPQDPVTDVSADEVQPSGAPILIRITVTNTGQGVIAYSCPGPGKYPDAREFSARVVDSNGKIREATLSNGQAQAGGSAAILTIQSGQSLTLPAALAPLPVGSYVIQVGSGKSAKLVVKDDPQLLRTREQDVLKRIRQGEPFAQYVARGYPADSVTRALLQDLLSENLQVAIQAASTLQQMDKIPADAGPIIKQAMRMHLNSEERKRIRGASPLIDLACVAAKVGTDEAMSAVLVLANSNMGGETRGRAINQLGRFTQEQTVKALRDLLKENDEQIRFEAARTLANRKDPAALDVLLAVAGNEQSQWRGYAYPPLVNYPADPRVEPALKNGLNDSDNFVRHQARQALRELQKNQKK